MKRVRDRKAQDSMWDAGVAREWNENGTRIEQEMHSS